MAGERRHQRATRANLRLVDVAAHLARVLNEIVELMEGSGALLTLHASNGEPPAMVYADTRLPDQAHDAMLRQLATGVRNQFEDGECFWRESVGGYGAVLLLPVDQLDGHGRLVISVFFPEKLDAAKRSNAERLYRERRPFAVGFFQLWQRVGLLQQQVQSYESVLDQTAIGLVMINRSTQILFTNQTANEILEKGDGIGRSNGLLRATSLADGVNLQAAISHLLASGDPPSPHESVRAPLIAFRRKKAPPLVGALLPARTMPVERGDPAATLYLVDPQVDTGKMLAPLCRLYGLSPVEATLVCHLAAGATIALAAEQMHIKEPTARSYLKSIFIKTGTRRQAELVALMLSSLIRLRRDVLQEALASGGSARAADFCA